ncbi:solute carrier family 35 member F2 [Pogona vitticeps]|uniref:Solute carrier family 35 member F2 n=1 Tax=Pogona vitticeps TaxID=103695 RepID=A0A6J0UFB1_9SAUR|nr:solute carrier family 35 member F2 [Pogona vitticeps]
MEGSASPELSAANAAAAAAPAPGSPPAQPCGSARRLFWVRLKEKLCTWYIVKTLILGQTLSLFICGTAVTSQFLADKCGVNTPMLQSFINYCLLFLVYTTMLAFRKDGDSLFQILKRKWWKYIFLGLADVEANYTIVKAYQYTSITSVQLLDCFGIPVLMALSWFILHARYKLIHFIAVAICLLGVGTMVGADILAGRQDDEGSNVVIGDVLVLVGASLYAISNVSEEYIVKNLSRVEFLGMVGLFGTIISGVQLGIVEHKDIANIHWNWKIVLLFLAFALCMFGLYSFMPVVIKVTSATSVNLGILTADLYSLFFGIFLFGYKFSVLYLVSFVVIMVGFIMYCSTPTRTVEVISPNLPSAASTGFDNFALKIEESHLDALVVSPTEHNKEDSRAEEIECSKFTAL